SFASLSHLFSSRTPPPHSKLALSHPTSISSASSRTSNTQPPGCRPSTPRGSRHRLRRLHLLPRRRRHAERPHRPQRLPRAGDPDRYPGRPPRPRGEGPRRGRPRQEEGRQQGPQGRLLAEAPVRQPQRRQRQRPRRLQPCRRRRPERVPRIQGVGSLRARPSVVAERRPRPGHLGCCRSWRGRSRKLPLQDQGQEMKTSLL
ncbi:hypothetical protein CGCVW01_v000751, partial [Colletotrichum viniferum]